MKDNWDDLFGEVPASFEERMRTTLSSLEEKPKVRHLRFPMRRLIAAVLMVNCRRTEAEMANKNQEVDDAEDAVVSNVDFNGSVLENDEIMVSSSKGTLIRTRVAEVRLCSRSSMGVRIMRLADDDVVTAVARIIPSEAIAAEAEQDKANVRAMNDALAGFVEMSASDPRYQESETLGTLTAGADDAGDTSEWELLKRAEEEEE